MVKPETKQDPIYRNLRKARQQAISRGLERTKAALDESILVFGYERSRAEKPKEEEPAQEARP